jgi:hypothetical protein
MADRAPRWVLGLVLGLPQGPAAAAAPAPDPDFEALLEFLGEAAEAGESWDRYLDTLPPEPDQPPPEADPETDTSQ